MRFIKKKVSILLAMVMLLLITVILTIASQVQATDTDRVYFERTDDTKCDEHTCYFPGKDLIDKDIYVSKIIEWNDKKDLVLHTRGNIVFEEGARIIVKGNASIFLKSGLEPGIRDNYDGTVKFEDNTIKIESRGQGWIKIYYNPTKGLTEYKYFNPKYNYYKERIKAATNKLSLYMLVNDIYDLQNIGAFLSGDYALSQNINARVTKYWNAGKWFDSLKDATKNMSFSGNFDGNGYAIEELFIKRSEENDVGLFGICGGSGFLRNKVENLTIKNSDVTGGQYVGNLAGFAANTDFSNITVINPKVRGKNVVGVFIGTANKVKAENLQIVGKVEMVSSEDNGLIIEGASECTATLLFKKAR